MRLSEVCKPFLVCAAREAWARVGKFCVAPGSYDGICSPAMDFSSYSLEDVGGLGPLITIPWGL